MPGKKPYEGFGPYVLLRKLESDAFGDLHRALRIENGEAGQTVALRRFTRGNLEALTGAAQAAEQIAASLTGPTFVKDQRIEIIDGVVSDAQLDLGEPAGVEIECERHERHALALQLPGHRRRKKAPAHEEH